MFFNFLEMFRTTFQSRKYISIINNFAFLYGVGLILRVNWLKTLGPHITNYNKLQLKFLFQSKFTTSRGL